MIYGNTRKDFCNTAFGTGTGPSGTVVSDSSMNGYNSDLDGNGNPSNKGEDVCTPLTLESIHVFIPSGFSPDGDGINDVFVIRGLSDYPDNKFTVYNRWGNIVYEAVGYGKDYYPGAPLSDGLFWDGKPNKGILHGSGLLPQGTYYYVLDYNKGDKKPANGYLIIQY